jgi:hypothetical protein
MPQQQDNIEGLQDNIAYLNGSVLVKKKIERVVQDLVLIQKDKNGILYKRGLPSYALLLMTLIFSISFPFLVKLPSEQSTYWYAIVVLLPIASAIIFWKLSQRAYDTLKIEVRKGDSSDSEITRIIDKYSGIVDAIGTALPLAGAAILIGLVGSGSSKEEFNKYFTGFAIPFEIVSVLILASARLFESVFDELSLKFQEIIDHTKNVETEHYHEMNIQAIENISAPNAAQANNYTFNFDNVSSDDVKKIFEDLFEKVIDLENNKINQVVLNMSEMFKTVGTGLANENVAKSLDSITQLAGLKAIAEGKLFKTGINNSGEIDDKETSGKGNGQ